MYVFLNHLFLFVKYSYDNTEVCVFQYLTLHQRPLKLLPPVLQGGSQPIPAGVHLFQAVPQLPCLLRVWLCLEEVSAPQVDGEDL